MTVQGQEMDQAQVRALRERERESNKFQLRISLGSKDGPSIYRIALYKNLRLIAGDGNDEDGETEELKDLTWLSYVGIALILIALILLAVRRKTCQWKLCC